MILLIDNYDSFSYNLYQLIGSVEPDVRVVRNDAITVDEAATYGADAIVLSPGPGRPTDAGICEDVVRRLSGSIPILGVCLGHQAICEAWAAGSSTRRSSCMARPLWPTSTPAAGSSRGSPSPRR